MLFDRKTDPQQVFNLASQRPEAIRDMRALLSRLMEEEGAPPEQFERLRLLRA
jgi:hypothetical protein